MAGLIAPPDNADPDNATVAADGWFPPVPLAGIRDTIRLGEGVVTTARLQAAIEGAILTCLRALADWRSARALSGMADLDSVTEDQVAGQNKAVLLWQRAVRYYAAAELADQHRDVTATDDGLDRADEKTETADAYRRLAYAAVADLLSIGAEEPEPRNRVSLV
jgi:hypothetical protein